ncbi:MAG: hypothetical protein HXP18_02680 [Veillonella sp.]|nr:hypothetical protein [Veillonella sp.]
MITDKQGREWLIKKFYEMGCNKIDARTSTARFIKLNGTRSITVGHVPDVMIGMENRQELIDIAEELGIIDWSKVKVDTPVLVKTYEQDAWQKRYFAYLKGGRVYVWLCGTTSWSADNDKDVMSWNYAKLAEV